MSKSITVGSIAARSRAKGWEPKGEVTVESKWPDKKAGQPDAKSNRNVGFFLDTIGVTPWLNEFDGRRYVNEGGVTRRLDDDVERDLRMRMFLEGCRPTAELFSDAVRWFADQRRAHPVRNYLDGLRWDGVPRLDDWLCRYAGAEDTEYTRVIGRKSLIAAVRRVRMPGCKFDNMLVLEGPENIGKSRLLERLASTEWFTDNLRMADDAKAVQEITAGKWLVEIAELDGLTRREVEAQKAFVSRQTDSARAAYARYAKEVPRQFTLWGTTNDSQYLTSRTGNRRFWCCAVTKIDLTALERDRDQLWAEAAHYDAEGEALYLSAEQQFIARGEQQKREVVDQIEQRIVDLLSGVSDAFVPTEELFSAVGLEDVQKRAAHHAKSIGRAMKALGWCAARARDGDGSRARGYATGNVREHYKYRTETKAFARCRAA